MGQKSKAATAVALFAFSLTAIAASSATPAYSVTELRFKPIDPSMPNEVTPAAIDAQGRAVINVYAASTAGEQCSVVGRCKMIGPAGHRNNWLAAAGNVLGGQIVDEEQGWAARRSGTNEIEKLWVGEVRGVNASGAAAGTANNSAVVFDTTLHHLPDLSSGGGQSSQANAVNKTGMVVGGSTGPLGNYCAVAWEGFALRVLQCAPAVYDSNAYAVNAKGIAVGESSYVEVRRPHAVRYEKGAMIDLGTLGGTKSDSSSAFAINASGVVVGRSTDVTHGGGVRATRFDKTGPVDLATLIPEVDRAKYTMSYAVAINDAGQILVGATRTSDDRSVVLRLDPVTTSR